MSKLGRNTPCPCGSGKKYKKCCAEKLNVPPSTPAPDMLERNSALMEAAASSNMGTDFLKMFREAVGEHAFESQQELNQAINEFKEKINTKPLPDFLGLNSQQMHRISSQPIDALNDMLELRFPEGNQLYVGTPIMQIAISIMLHIREANGLKITQQSNLPLHVVEEMYEHMPDLYDKLTPTIQSEENLPELFIVRNLLEVADLTKTKDSYLHLSQFGTKLLDDVMNKKTAALLYQELFLQYTNRFNWRLYSRFDDSLGFIQHTALFDLFILHKKANQLASEQILANTYAKAFPSFCEKLTRMKIVPPHMSAQELVANAFSVLFIHKYCWMFGLLDQQVSNNTEQYVTTDLFRKIFHWKI